MSGLVIGLLAGYDLGRSRADAPPAPPVTEPAAPDSPPSEAPAPAPAPEPAPKPAPPPLIEVEEAQADVHPRDKRPNTPFSLSRAPLIGNPAKAKTTIVLFCDLDGVPCGALAPILKTLIGRYEDDLAVAFRHIPRAQPLPAVRAGAWRFPSLDLAKLRAGESTEATAQRLELDTSLFEVAQLPSTPGLLINGSKRWGDVSLADLDAIVRANIARVTAAMDGGASLLEARGEVTLTNVIGNQIPNGDPSRLPRVPIEGAPGKGAEDPLVAVVEFGDFECSFCAEIAELLSKLVAEFPDTVRLVFRHNPQPSHADAHLAAQAAMAAHAQGKFWEYHDKLLARQEKLGRQYLDLYAQELRLDLETFYGALNEKTFAPVVTADMARAVALELEGTPTLMINGLKVSGVPDYAQLRRYVKVARMIAEEQIRSGAATREGYYAQLMAQPVPPARPEP